ncbi:MAG: hypothetical protein ACRD9W_01135 [Terriglobia bacterium]
MKSQQGPVRAIAKAWAFIVAAAALNPAVADENLASTMTKGLGSDIFSIQDDGHGVNITWKCPGDNGQNNSATWDRYSPTPRSWKQ